MLKNIYIYIYYFFIFFSFNADALGQNTNSNATEIDSKFNAARDYFQKGQLSLAYPLFKSLYYDKSVAERNSPLSVDLKSDLQFYTLACGLSTNDSTVVKDAKQFEEQSSNAAKGQMISFYLAEYYYRHVDYLSAVEYYGKAGYDNLSKEQRSAARFNKGYAYFLLKDYTSAGPLLYMVSKDPHDKNYLDANYYYGFIALQEKDYTSALNAFMLAATSSQYKSTAPFYITEVYYFSGNVDRAIEYGRESLQKDGKIFYASDLQLLLAHAYFDQSDFEKALPFLQTYSVTVPKLDTIDTYELAVCNYHEGNYDSAISEFSTLMQLHPANTSGGQDSIYQNSKYLLATCYLKIGQLEKARQLFLESSLFNNNLQQKENAAFNYATTTFDIGEYDSAYIYLKKFKKDYPNSSFNMQADDFMINLLARNGKFKEAYNYIAAIGHQSEASQQLYPYILYGYALELINTEKYSQAKNLLIQTVNFESAGDTTKQLAYFYLGKAYYNLGKYDTALLAIQEYLKKPITAGNDVSVQSARYTLGYVYLQAGDYGNSLKYFKMLVTKIGMNSSPIEMDVYRREGDCYYMQKDLKKASRVYNDLITYNYSDSAYCNYRLGLIENIGGQSDVAIQHLQQAASQGSGSGLSAQIQMETAQTYISQGNYTKAIPLLDSVLKNKQAGDSLYSKALLSLGICGINTNNHYIATDAYTKWELKYGNTQNSEEVIENLKRVYSENNRINGFIDFMKRTKNGITGNQEDSLYYGQAVNFYTNGDWKNAATAFNNYINKYPNGENLINAEYMLGNAEYNSKNYTNAVTAYQYIIDHKPNQYVNYALLSNARMYYFQIKDSAKALEYFTQLKANTDNKDTLFECLRGAIRIQYNRKDWKNGAINAKDLLNFATLPVDDNQLADFILGKNAQNNNNLDQANEYYNKVVSLGNTDYASEAQYNITDILINQNKLADAENAAYVITNSIKSSDNWIARGYYLLGKIYYLKKDYYNATATLKSVADNTSDANLKKDAQSLLDKVTVESSTNQSKTDN